MAKNVKNVFEPFIKAILKDDHVYLQRRENTVIVAGLYSFIRVQADYYNDVLRKLSKGVFVPLQDGQRAGRLNKRDLIELNTDEKHDFFKWVDHIESYTKNDLVNVVKTRFLMDSIAGNKNKIRIMKSDNDVITVFEDKIAPFDYLVASSEWKQAKGNPKALIHYTCNEYTAAFMPCYTDFNTLENLKEDLKAVLS